jgi:hypothetical protein
VHVGGQLEILRALHLDLVEIVGIGNDAVAPQGPCRGRAAIGLTVVGVLQQDADDLYTESLFELLVADFGTQAGVELNEAFPHSDVARHLTVFRYPMGAESREEGLFAEKPAFGDFGYSFPHTLTGFGFGC